MFKAIGSLLLVALCATACAQPAMVNEMLVSPETVGVSGPNDAEYHSLTVIEVSGGEETNPLWISTVNDAGFKAALEESLRAVEMLSPAHAAAKYRLRAQLASITQPLFVVTANITSSVNYTATDVATDEIVFQENIMEIGTATTGEAFVAVVRVRKANERSIRASLTTMITKLRAAIRDHEASAQDSQGAPSS